jgi:hypothetical protein
MGSDPQGLTPSSYEETNDVTITRGHLFELTALAMAFGVGAKFEDKWLMLLVIGAVAFNSGPGLLSEYLEAARPADPASDPPTLREARYWTGLAFATIPLILYVAAASRLLSILAR